MKAMTLRLTLKSGATFGSGDGVPGLVDRDIEHDINGFPYLRGRTLKGLLAESAENVVFALALQGQKQWRTIKESLLGRPGRGLKEQGVLHVGDARLPESLRYLIQHERQSYPEQFTPDKVLTSLTTIRRQTAMNPDGGPDRTTLRAMRVLLPGTVLESPLTFQRDPTTQEMGLLVAAVLDWRRAGTGRNRGRGWIEAVLNDSETTRRLFEQFAEAIQP